MIGSIGNEQDLQKLLDNTCMKHKDSLCPLNVWPVQSVGPGDKCNCCAGTRGLRRMAMQYSALVTAWRKDTAGDDAPCFQLPRDSGGWYRESAGRGQAHSGNRHPVQRAECQQKPSSQVYCHDQTPRGSIGMTGVLRIQSGTILTRQ